MSYAVTRTKLANLLIKAGYDKAKSLNAVRYPYVEAIQLRHNQTFHAIGTKDVMKFQRKGDNYEKISESGFVTIQDTKYDMLAEYQKARAYLVITQDKVNIWQNAGYTGVPWWSYLLKVRLKYRHRYPRNEEIDAVKSIGTARGGYATTAGEHGNQENTIPLPVGGWEKIELLETNAE